MSDHDFQSTVLAALAELKTEVKNIVSRLDRLNGTVARHERELGEMKIEVAERRNQCPLVDQVDARLRSVEDFVTAERATEQNSKTWKDRIWPFVWAAIGILFLLVLQHSNELLPHVAIK